MKIISVKDIEKLKDENNLGQYIKMCKTKEIESDIVNTLNKLSRSAFEIILNTESELKTLSRKHKEDSVLKSHSYESLKSQYSFIILDEDNYLNLRDDR